MPGESDQGTDEVRAFTRAVLRDLGALERILDEGLIETGCRRFGAEQEMFLVDRDGRPAPMALEMLDRLGGAPFTTELGLFNLEANLDPLQLEGRCLGRLERRLRRLVGRAHAVAEELGGEVVLTGILPSIMPSDLSLDRMTPVPRYRALNEAMMRLGGGVSQLRIDGVDELRIEHDSVMLEACTTSFQVHLQTAAEEFAHLYNCAQAVTGPLLAACANSPLLFGKQLWAETRIAVFQQTLDTRGSRLDLRHVPARVHFGEAWVERSVTELFRDDLAHFRVLLAAAGVEDPQGVLDAGGVPKLEALQLYNGTVYRWNRPCYGILGGKPHLRIECRVLPSGPSVVDEVANAAFWIGLVLGCAEAYPDLTRRMGFDHARTNFLTAARLGLDAGFRWIDGRAVDARTLILEELLPLAYRGLASAGVAAVDAERYLEVLRERVELRCTGSQWALRSLGAMSSGSRSERLAAITTAMGRFQRQNTPAHLWTRASSRHAGAWERNYQTVEQCMRTDLVTVHEEDPVDLAAFLMDHERVRHVLVEDDENRLVGLVSYRAVLRLLTAGVSTDGDSPPVKDIMERSLLTVAPDTPIVEALELMCTHCVPVLPVLRKDRLVGLLGEAELVPVAYALLEERLSGADDA